MNVMHIILVTIFFAFRMSVETFDVSNLAEGFAPTSFGKKIKKCSNSITNCPVLGGHDVVSFQQSQHIKRPVLGTVNFSVILTTKAGHYAFFFKSSENRQLFVQDPWRFAPSWGGFDAWQIVQTAIIRGKTSKLSLPVKTNPTFWLVTDTQRTFMFEDVESRDTVWQDTDYWAEKGDARWIELWGGLKDGPFATPCLERLTFSVLWEASDLYKSGGLNYGKIPLQEGFTSEMSKIHGNGVGGVEERRHNTFEDIANSTGIFEAAKLSTHPTILPEGKQHSATGYADEILPENSFSFEANQDEELDEKAIKNGDIFFQEFTVYQTNHTDFHKGENTTEDLNATNLEFDEVGVSTGNQATCCTPSNDLSKFSGSEEIVFETVEELKVVGLEQANKAEQRIDEPMLQKDVEHIQTGNIDRNSHDPVWSQVIQDPEKEYPFPCILKNEVKSSLVSPGAGSNQGIQDPDALEYPLTHKTNANTQLSDFTLLQTYQGMEAPAALENLHTPADKDAIDSPTHNICTGIQLIEHTFVETLSGTEEPAALETIQTTPTVNVDSYSQTQCIHADTLLLEHTLVCVETVQDDEIVTLKVLLTEIGVFLAVLTVYLFLLDKLSSVSMPEPRQVRIICVGLLKLELFVCGSA